MSWKWEFGSGNSEVGSGNAEVGKGNVECGNGNADFDELSRLEVGKERKWENAKRRGGRDELFADLGYRLTTSSIHLIAD